MQTDFLQAQIIMHAGGVTLKKINVNRARNTTEEFGYCIKGEYHNFTSLLELIFGQLRITYPHLPFVVCDRRPFPILPMSEDNRVDLQKAA